MINWLLVDDKFVGIEKYFYRISYKGGYLINYFLRIKFHFF